MNFKMLKLTCGNLFKRPLNANKRQLRSVLTSIFIFDGAPDLDRIDAVLDEKRKMFENVKVEAWLVCLIRNCSCVEIGPHRTYLQFLRALSSRLSRTPAVKSSKRNLSMRLQPHSPVYRALQYQHLDL